MIAMPAAIALAPSAIVVTVGFVIASRVAIPTAIAAALDGAADGRDREQPENGD
jgi:hypothetical protein